MVNPTPASATNPNSVLRRWARRDIERGSRLLIALLTRPNRRRDEGEELGRHSVTPRWQRRHDDDTFLSTPQFREYHGDHRAEDRQFAAHVALRFNSIS